MHTRHLIWILLSATLACAPGGIQAQKPQPAESGEPITVSASYSNAGPYGELWIAYLAPDGDLTVRVTHRYAQAQTNSHYLPNKERVNAIYQALLHSRFFDLRPEIAPTTQHFHRPHYRLTITQGVKQHSVAVYDPSTIDKNSEEVKRFFTVWDALFTKLPFLPEAHSTR